jgi:hypothetical protein
MGIATQPRDERGRWTSGGSGSETGDHLSESPSTETRNVAGMNVPRSRVIAKHAGAESVGTAPPTVRLDNANSPSTKRGLGSARQDRITQMRATDQRHFGIPGDVGSRVGKMLPKDLRGPSAKGWPFNNG